MSFNFNKIRFGRENELQRPNMVNFGMKLIQQKKIDKHKIQWN